MSNKQTKEYANLLQLINNPSAATKHSLIQLIVLDTNVNTTERIYLRGCLENALFERDILDEVIKLARQRLKELEG